MLQNLATIQQMDPLIERPSASSADSGPAFSQNLRTEDLSLFMLVEYLLKDQATLNQLLRGAAGQRRSIPILLAIGLAGSTLFGMTLSLIYSCAGLWPQMIPLADWLNHRHDLLIRFVPVSEAGRLQIWTHGPALHVVLSYAFGLAGAIGICLPSFYFYSLLAGVRTNMLHVATCALNALASGAVAVLGVLPIYVVLMLGLIIVKAPERVLHLAAFAGMLLPFIAGLYGTRALYLSFISLSDTMAEDRRPARETFLQLLLLAWSTCYSIITPVMIFTFWESLSKFQL